MTIDARPFLPLAEHAVSIASEIIKSKIVTARGGRNTATAVDKAVEHAVREFLSREIPEIGFLGEKERVTRVGAGVMWALDSMGSAVNFLHGMPLCGVSLGLWHQDDAILGVIDLPFLNLRYTAAQGFGAQANGSRIQISGVRDLEAAVVAVGDYVVGPDGPERNKPRLAVTRELAARAQRVRMFGSAAIDLAWVADGKIDANIMLSNNQWDTAAGVAIAREAGAVVVDVDGSPHTMTAYTTIAASPELVVDLLELVAEARKSTGQCQYAADYYL